MMSAGLLRVGERRRNISRREHRKVNQAKPAGAHQRADRWHAEQPRHHRSASHGPLSPGTRVEGGHDGATELAQEAYRLWQDLPAHDVLFCPMGHLESAPVGRAGHLADVFVLCDWRWPLCPTDKFDAMPGGLINDDGEQDGRARFGHDAGRGGFALPVEQVEAITGPSEDFGLFHEPAWKAGQQPWGRIARLQRRGSERALWLVYIVGNCIEVYQRLFLERGSAPKVLWLDPPLGADLDGWVRFISSAGEFGHVFSKAVRQPNYVAAQRYQPGWRQTVLCQRLPAWHPSWDLTVFALPDVPMGADGDGLSPLNLATTTLLFYAKLAP